MRTDRTHCLETKEMFKGKRHLKTYKLERDLGGNNCWVLKKNPQNNWYHVVVIRWLITNAQLMHFPLFLNIVSVDIKRYSA